MFAMEKSIPPTEYGLTNAFHIQMKPYLQARNILSKMDMFSFREEVLRLIALRQEGEYWDFKKEWHKSKPDLLHDIICMANNITNHDGLIIIGVDEETDYSICNVANDQNRKKTQDIVAFLREKKFAGGIRPTVYV